MTIRTLSSQLGIQPASLQRRITRKGLPSYKIDDILPDTVVILFTQSDQPSSDTIIQKKEDRPAQRTKSLPVKRKSFDFIKLLQVAPLPMLGLAASYGVYFFASQFVPVAVAIGEAAAFELTYIGLTSMKGLNEKQQNRARKVSLWAVIVSVIYNTLAGAIHQDATILKDLNRLWFWTLAVIHGAPLATLAYFVADLIFHQKK